MLKSCNCGTDFNNNFCFSFNLEGVFNSSGVFWQLIVITDFGFIDFSPLKVRKNTNVILSDTLCPNNKKCVKNAIPIEWSMGQMPPCRHMANKFAQHPPMPAAVTKKFTH